jgi:hypothetical protein
MCKKMGDCDLKVNDIKKSSSGLPIMKFYSPLQFLLKTGETAGHSNRRSLPSEPEGNKYNDFIIRSQIVNPELPVYHDNYWEAFLVKPGKKVVLKGSVSIKHKDGKAVYRK